MYKICLKKIFELGSDRTDKFVKPQVWTGKLEMKITINRHCENIKQYLHYNIPQVDVTNFKCFMTSKSMPLFPYIIDIYSLRKYVNHKNTSIMKNK